MVSNCARTLLCAVSRRMTTSTSHLPSLPGLGPLLYACPALKRWAKICRPSGPRDGTGRKPGLKGVLFTTLKRGASTLLRFRTQNDPPETMPAIGVLRLRRRKGRDASAQDDTVKSSTLFPKHKPLGHAQSLARHRDLDSLLLREVLGFVVAGVGVAGDADAGIVGQDALDALGHLVSAICNRHLSGVLRVADAHATSVVDGDPGRAAGGVEQGVEQGPVGDGVAAIFHGFGFSVWRSDRAAVEMVATHDDGRLELASLDHVVHGEAEFGALAVAEPADARGESLKLDALAGEVDPAAEDAVVREHLQDQIVGGVDVGGIAGERRPAKRAAAFAEERPNVGGHEAREIVGVLHAMLKSEGANVVPVVEGDGAHLLELEHAFNVAGHGVERLLDIGLGIALAQLESGFERHAARYVAVERVVRGSLVGENVGHDAAVGQLGDDVTAVADEADGDVFLLADGVLQDAQRLVERVDHEVAVAGAQALLDALGVDLDAEVTGAGHGGGKGLRSAHAAHAAGDDEFAGEVSAEMFFPGSGEGFVGALNDALRADVNPRAGGHLAVHDEAELFELVELLPVRPMADEV